MIRVGPAGTNADAPATAGSRFTENSEVLPVAVRVVAVSAPPHPPLGIARPVRETGESIGKIVEAA